MRTASSMLQPAVRAACMRSPAAASVSSAAARRAISAGAPIASKPAARSFSAALSASPISDTGRSPKAATAVRGKLAGESIVYAAMGLNFRDPKEAFDASKYEGITFFAKRTAASTSRLVVKLPDGNTDPDGGICSACYNDYGAAITVGTQWQRYVLPFRDLRQEPDWGAPRKPHLDRTKVFAIHWEAKASGADFDFFVDDIAFICKG